MEQSVRFEVNTRWGEDKDEISSAMGYRAVGEGGSSVQNPDDPED